MRSVNRIGTLSRLCRGSRGAALIETGLVVVFVTMILVSVMELAIVFSRHARLTYVITHEARAVAVDSAGVGNPDLNPASRGCRQEVAEYAARRAAEKAQTWVHLGDGSMPNPTWDGSDALFNAAFPGVATVTVGNNRIRSGVTCELLNNVCMPVLHLQGEVAGNCMACRFLPSLMFMQSKVDAVLEDECIFRGSVGLCCKPKPNLGGVCEP